MKDREARGTLLSVWRTIGGLTFGTSGNASVRVDKNSMLIKPSAMSYEDMTADDLVYVQLSPLGSLIIGSKKPSTDTAAHAYIYTHCSDVGAVVHTHSPYVTAFATIGADIPCALTQMADYFGGDVLCAPAAEIGNEDMGVRFVEHRNWRGGSKHAVLISRHGSIVTGTDLKRAVDRAVALEASAHVIWAAACMSRGGLASIERLPQEYITLNYERYQGYGQ